MFAERVGAAGGFSPLENGSARIVAGSIWGNALEVVARQALQGKGFKSFPAVFLKGFRMIEELKKEFSAWDATIMSAENVQPYFREYCREWNFPSLEAAKAAGGVEGFVCWIGSKWMKWREETQKQGVLNDDDYTAFSAWLPGAVNMEIKRITEAPELNCHGGAD